MKTIEERITKSMLFFCMATVALLPSWSVWSQNEGLLIKKDIAPAITNVLEHHDFAGVEHIQRGDNIRATVSSATGPVSVNATWEQIVTAAMELMSPEDQHLIAMHFLAHECDYNEEMTLFISPTGDLEQAIHTKHFYSEQDKVQHWQLNADFKKLINFKFSSAKMANSFLSKLRVSKPVIPPYSAIPLETKTPVEIFKKTPKK